MVSREKFEVRRFWRSSVLLRLLLWWLLLLLLLLVFASDLSTAKEQPLMLFIGVVVVDSPVDSPDLSTAKEQPSVPPAVAA